MFKPAFKYILSAVWSVLVSALFASPISVEWAKRELCPVKTARPYCGFLADGGFVVAGGSDFISKGGKAKKIYRRDVFLRSPSGKWSAIGRLPVGLAEGVSCSTPLGLFCASGTDGRNKYTDSFVITENGVRPLRGAELPEPAVMGAAASEGSHVYVVASKNVYCLNVGNIASGWKKLGQIPGPARLQPVAAIQNGDQKEKVLVVFGGYDPSTGKPLGDGYALVLSSLKWKKLSAVPDGVTTIGAAFMPSGHQHILLVGGFGAKGWVDRFTGASSETDPVKLGWQREIYAYNCVTDAWCKYAQIADDDTPRCGAAAGLKTGKVPEQYLMIIAGGETSPGKRTDEVSIATFRKVGGFGAVAWTVVGVYAAVMLIMALVFICRKKDENDYFRGGKKIPWYVAGMSMLSSITFIAMPTQTYMQDWRYFIIAILIFAVVPVAIYYYLPFFCRLGITSAYEYLEMRFNLGVRLFGSAAFVAFTVCRIAVVTILPAIALNAVTGVSIDACILICGIFTVVFCSLGGLGAVIWYNFVQCIVLIAGAVAAFVILVVNTGADGEHTATFLNIASEYGKNTLWDFRFVLTEPVFLVVAVQGLVSNLSCYTSDQCVIQRYIATPDENATRRSLWFNGVMTAFAQAVFFGIGMALFSYYHTNPETMDVTMPRADSVLPVFMATQMPSWLAGLVIAAIFATTISTLSANLSSASTAIVTDFIKRFFPRISGGAQVRCGQISTVVIGVIGIAEALSLARFDASALYDDFNNYVAVLTAGLTGLFFMGVFMPRVKGCAAIAGLAANYIVCFGGRWLGCKVMGVEFHSFLLGGMGLIACIAVSYVASFLFRERARNLKGLTLKTLN